MSTSDWVGVATLVVAVIAVLRSFGRDGTQWIKELFKTLSDRLKGLEDEHKAYKEQQTTVLRDHYLHRRDFEKHERTQKEDFDEIKVFMREVREKMENLPDAIIKRLSK